MPRFNARGAVTQELGQSWYDEARFIYQDCSSGICRIVLSDGTVIAEAGTNILLANGNRVWAYVDAATGHDDPTHAAYHDSSGRTFLNAFPHAISPDGAICVKPHSNLGATVLEPDGHDWRLSDGDAQNIQLLGNRLAIWTDGGIVQSNFPIIGNPKTPVYWPRVTADRLLLYQAIDGRLVLGGHVIAPASPFYFYPDVLLIDGVYKVCWSRSQADTDAQFLTLTPAQLAALPLVDTPAPKPVPVPVPPKPEPVPMSLPDPGAVKDALQRERDKFGPHITDAEFGTILNDAAAHFPHMGMHRKDGQSKQPVTGIGISHDVLRYLPPGDDFGWWSDVLGATGAGLGTPQAPDWKRSDDDARSFVPAVGAAPVPPVPVPVPSVPPTVPSELAAAVAQLQRDVAALKAWTRGVL